MLQTFQSSSAAERLGAASAVVERFPTATEVLIVGASRDAADDLARRVTAARRATFGLHRASLDGTAWRGAGHGAVPTVLRSGPYTEGLLRGALAPRGSAATRGWSSDR